LTIAKAFLDGKLVIREHLKIRGPAGSHFVAPLDHIAKRIDKSILGSHQLRQCIHILPVDRPHKRPRHRIRQFVHGGIVNTPGDRANSSISESIAGHKDVRAFPDPNLTAYNEKSISTPRNPMPLSGEAIRLMNYIDDVAVTLRRVLATIPTLTPDERARVAEHLLHARPNADDVANALAAD